MNLSKLTERQLALNYFEITEAFNKIISELKSIEADQQKRAKLIELVEIKIALEITLDELTEEIEKRGGVIEWLS